MTDSEDDSILDNISNTRQLWNAKAKAGPIDYLVPKSPISPIKPQAQFPVENGLNGHTHVDIIRAEDEVKDDFSSMPLPDVKSIKSQWEKPRHAAIPRKSHQTYEHRTTKTSVQNEHPVPEPVNRNQEETKEEYEVHLGKLKEKFELEAKAFAGTNPSLIEGPRSPVSTTAVDERKNLKKKHVTSNARSSGSNRSTKKRFEAEIQLQREYNPSNKEMAVEMPAVELSSIKQQFESRKDERAITPFNQTQRKTRQTSVCSDLSSHSAEIVRHEDREELINYEIELSSLRKKFEQKPSHDDRSKPFRASHSISLLQKKKVTHEQTEPSRTLSSDSDIVSNIKIVKSSDSKFDEMIGEESVKDRLARFKAMAQENEKTKVSKSFSSKKQSTVVSKKKEENYSSQETVEVDIVRSPPAGTKESPDYVPSIDLQETKLLFEQSSSDKRRSSQRSSRSSSGSPKRLPRSRSSPPNSRSSASNSQSPSPNRSRNSESGSRSSRSSSRGSPIPGNKSKKKTGDPDVVVLEHTEVSYYYQEASKRHTTKINGLEETDEVDMSADVIRPEPAGTKEEPDYVPSVNISSVRNMFENPQDEEKPSRGRGPPPKKAVILEKIENRCESALSESPERDPDVVRSAPAGSREEPVYALSVDLKAARSKFESPQRPNDYVPRNTIQKREEEARQRRVAAAAASPRSSESSDSSFEVVKTAEAGMKEKPGYTLSVDLKTTKQMFEHGGTPAPMSKRESSSTRVIQHQEVKGEVVRPEPAGTREVVVIQTPSDIKNVKQRFEHSEQQQQEVGHRKEPIDIQKEARDVIRKDREVKQESQQTEENEKGTSSESESQPTDTEGEVVLDQDSSEVESQDYSEEVSHVDRKTPTENDEEPSAAGVIPIRVAITEDLRETTYEEADPEPEANVGYNTYNKVIDYQEEVQAQPQSTSESESESGEESSVKKQSSPSPDSLVEVSKDQDRYDDEQQQEVRLDENHVHDSPEDSYNSEEQREESIEDDLSQDAGSPSDMKHQEGSSSPGKYDTSVNDKLLGDVGSLQLSTTLNTKSKDVIGPPQLSLSDNLTDPKPLIDSSADPFNVFTASFDPVTAPSGSSLLENSEDEDYDKPHFKYIYSNDQPVSNTNSNNNKLDIFGGSGDATAHTKSNGIPTSGIDLLSGFESAPVDVSSTSLLGDFQENHLLNSNQNALPSSDIFDLFATPYNQPASGSKEKDPFDLFA